MAAFVSLKLHLLGEPKPPRAAPIDAPVDSPDKVDRRELDRQQAHRAAMDSLRDAEAEMRAATKLLTDTAKAIEDTRRGLLDEVRASTAGVILEAARRIAGEALHADPRLLEAIVDEAVRTLGRSGLVVKVSPLDGEMLRGVLQGRGIEVVEDFFMEGGCVCEGPAGCIDASVERAVAGVAAVLDQWK